MRMEILETPTPARQLGTIGSELARARHGEGKGDEERREAALFPALELIDPTLDDPRRRGGYREIARLREIVCDRYAGTQTYDVSPGELEDYCTGFARVRRALPLAHGSAHGGWLAQPSVLSTAGSTPQPG